MGEPINEKVKVIAVFDNGIFPIAMDWNNRHVRFRSLIFKSAHRVGEKRFVDLVCRSDTASFELEFDSESYVWWLKRVIPE